MASSEKLRGVPCRTPERNPSQASAGRWSAAPEPPTGSIGTASASMSRPHGAESNTPSSKGIPGRNWPSMTRPDSGPCWCPPLWRSAKTSPHSSSISETYARNTGSQFPATTSISEHSGPKDESYWPSPRTAQPRRGLPGDWTDSTERSASPTAAGRPDRTIGSGPPRDVTLRPVIARRRVLGVRHRRPHAGRYLGDRGQEPVYVREACVSRPALARSAPGMLRWSPARTACR